MYLFNFTGNPSFIGLYPWEVYQPVCNPYAAVPGSAVHVARHLLRLCVRRMKKQRRHGQLWVLTLYMASPRAVITSGMPWHRSAAGKAARPMQPPWMWAGCLLRARCSSRASSCPPPRCPPPSPCHVSAPDRNSDSGPDLCMHRIAAPPVHTHRDHEIHRPGTHVGEPA